MQIRCDEIDGIIRIYDKTRYLTLLGPKRYDTICDKIRYLINLKTIITYIFSHYSAEIKRDSNYSLATEKLTLHNVVILIKSLLNKD